MRITIAAIGRARAGPATALLEIYRKRCPWPLRLLEIVPRRQVAADRQLADQAERLLKAVPERALIIALDERGSDLGSRGFAEQIGAWQQSGRRELAFLIGGPDGLDPRVRERADLVLALGRMTWPHQLVPVLLAEQLYRASCILAGHPYHRD